MASRMTSWKGLRYNERRSRSQPVTEAKFKPPVGEP